MDFRLFTLTVFFIFSAIAVHAQDNWTGIVKSVPVQEYSGKKFRYTATVKTDGSAAVLALIGARVVKANGEPGFFSHGGDQPVWKTTWTTRTIEGSIDSGAASINLGLVCMGKGTCWYDGLQLQVEAAPGQWKSIPVPNAGFESSAFVNNLPEGWVVDKPAPGFTFHIQNEAAFEGTQALAITGTSDDESPVLFIKGSAVAREHYSKTEYEIPVRDGVTLFTAVYTPKDASATKAYPIMLHRTPYSIGPYGATNFPFTLGPDAMMVDEGYIFVHQDVRGRFKSGGTWTNMTPHIANKKSNKEVDESTDTWDTIDWLLKNVKYNNGKVGQWGISYPAFYATAGSINAHPALKAVSPQAPVADYFFDDFHHNGALTQAYLPFFYVVGTPRPAPTDQQWFPFFDAGTADSYAFHQRFGTVKELGDSLLKNNFLWNEIVAHPNYDTFWKARRITNHFKNLKPAYLIVGGWFDAEDLYGTLTTYKEIEKANKGIYNTLVMGPFGHGNWSHEDGHHLQKDIYYGDSIATFYQRNIEAKFFNHFLKGTADTATGLPEAYLYNTGTKEWQTFSAWPGKVQKQKFYFAGNETLSFTKPAGNGFSEYVSDPAKPVPFSMDIPGSFGMTPRSYMNEDQRFAARRPDVLVFETGVLTEDVTIGGEITVKLNVSSTGTDADWVVKLIDVYPDNEPNTPYTPKGVSLGGYQQLVRGDVMRSRWRNSFEKPAPLIPNKVTPVSFQLLDVLHTFKKGHRVMVQVQSSWYPLIDLNPQTFVPSIYKAGKKDFRKATQRVYHSAVSPSYLEVDVLK